MFKQTVQKMSSFFFPDLQLITILFLIAILTRAEAQGSSHYLIFHFQFRFILIKVYIFV